MIAMRMTTRWARSLFLLLAISTLAGTGGGTEAGEILTSELLSPITAWTEAAEKGEPWACFNLALAYHTGHRVGQNFDEAVKWYRVAAEKGFAPAQANLGYCYETGIGVTISYREALRWYQQAAVKGNPFAQFNLGKKFLAGTGGMMDPELAKKWLRQAAQQGIIEAYFSLGQLYSSELAGERDFTEAVKWYRLAAERGFPAAQHALGFLFHQGQGVPQDYAQAIRWYKMAAARNFSDSHYNLGICYERGLGVPQSLIAAAQHYMNAAQFGHAYAQYNLGVCYYQGKGVETDFIEAYKWWNLAAFQGVSEAALSRQIVSNLLSESQIKEGQLRASSFQVQTRPGQGDGLVLIQETPVMEVKKICTGFFVTEDGYLITTYGAISGGNQLKVVTEGGTFDVRIVQTDAFKDLALLKVEGTFQAIPATNSRGLAVDTEIFMVGFENQGETTFNPKFARGKINNLMGLDPRQFSLEPRLSDGFTGAAVINPHGFVIGVVRSDVKLNGNQTHVSLANHFAIKSEHLLAFLRSTPEAKVSISDTLPREEPIEPEEVLMKARAATALILVL
jgi:TPR repeat protein